MVCQIVTNLSEILREHLCTGLCHEMLQVSAFDVAVIAHQSIDAQVVERMNERRDGHIGQWQSGSDVESGGLLGQCMQQRGQQLFVANHDGGVVAGG